MLVANLELNITHLQRQTVNAEQNKINPKADGKINVIYCDELVPKKEYQHGTQIIF